MKEMQQTWVQSLVQEDPLDKEVAIHSSMLAWKIPIDRRTWWAAVHGVSKLRHDWATEHSAAQDILYYNLMDHYRKISSVQSLNSVQSLSHVWLFVTPMDCSMPGLLVHHQLLETAQTYVHRVGDAIQPSHPLSSPSPPAVNLSQHQALFKRVSSWHQVAKVLEFQLQHQSFQWISRTDLLGRMDWLDLLAVQGTFKSLLQHHSSKVSILWHSAFFTVQLSHPHMTTGKTIALNGWTLLAK